MLAPEPSAGTTAWLALSLFLWCGRELCADESLAKKASPVVQDAVVWNATYIVRGRQAIFGAFQLWCALNHIEVKINRIGEPPLSPLERAFSSVRCASWGRARMRP